MAAAKDSKRKIAFSIKAPAAQSVLLVGDFSDWQASPIPLKQLKSGLWKATVPLAEGRYEYRYLVDGVWTDDPDCVERAANQYGGENCVRVVP